MIFLALIGIAIVTISVGAVVYVQRRMVSMQDMTSNAQQDAASLRQDMTTLKGDAAMRVALKVTESEMIDRMSRIKRELRDALDGEITARTGTDARVGVLDKRVGSLNDDLASETAARAAAVADVLSQLSDTEKRLIAQDNVLAQKIQDLANSAVSINSDLGDLQQVMNATVDVLNTDVPDMLASLGSNDIRLAQNDMLLAQAMFTAGSARTLSNAIYNTMQTKVDAETTRASLSNGILLLNQNKADKTALDALKNDMSTYNQTLQGKVSTADMNTKLGTKVDTATYNQMMTEYGAYKTQTNNALLDHTNRITKLEGSTLGTTYQNLSNAFYPYRIDTDARLQALSNGLYPYRTSTDAKLSTLCNSINDVNTSVTGLNMWKGTASTAIANLQSVGQDYATWKGTTNTTLTNVQGSVQTLCNAVLTLSNQVSTFKTATQASGNTATTALTDYQTAMGNSISTKKLTVTDSNVLPGGTTWTSQGIKLAGTAGSTKVSVLNPNGNEIHRLDGNGDAIHAGSVKLQNGGCMEVGNGVSGKDVNAGKICYANTTQGAMDVFGAGGSGTSRRIKLWDEVESGKYQVGQRYYLGSNMDSDGLVRFKAVGTDATMGFAGDKVQANTGVFTSGLTASNVTFAGPFTSAGAVTLNAGLTVSGSNLKVNNANCVELGAGANKDAAAGTMCYTADGLAITGAGTAAGNHKVKVVDNLAVQGNVDVTGVLRINGKAITPGMQGPAGSNGAPGRDGADGKQGPPGPALTSIAGNNNLEFGAGVAGKEANAGKIGYNAWNTAALDIVGAGTAVGNRTVRVHDKLQVNGGIDVMYNDPGPLVQKQYSGVNDRYGIGQFPNGATRVYTATSIGQATANLSLAKADGTFRDVVKVDTGGTTTFDGQVNIVNQNKGDWTVFNYGGGADNYIRGGNTSIDTGLYINKGANVTGDMNVSGRLCVGGKCTGNGPQCADRVTNWAEYHDALTWIDRHAPFCGDDEYMTGWQFYRNSSGNQAQMKYRCCKVAAFR